jgi:hypothetical protein
MSFSPARAKEAFNINVPKTNAAEIVTIRFMAHQTFLFSMLFLLFGEAHVRHYYAERERKGVVTAGAAELCREWLTAAGQPVRKKPQKPAFMQKMAVVIGVLSWPK